MNYKPVQIDKPQRWDTPFDEGMSADDVERLMRIEPFSRMDESAFAGNISLRGILQNDCRIRNFSEGEIVIREGDYGSSAFLILEGELLVAFQKLPEHVLGRSMRQRKSFFEALAQLWGNSRHPESRDYAEPTGSSDIRTSLDADQTRVFIQDIPRVLDLNQSERLYAGEIFGEISALTRTPRSASIIATGNAVVLEIRWQGLRDLMKRDQALREHIDQQYREHSLQSHLRATDLLKDLPQSELERLADYVQFESYGNFDWQFQFQSSQKKDIADQLRSEPVIAEQGDYTNGLLLIRNGFARLSRPYGHGHQTIAYLGKGDSFGLRELTHNWQTGEQRPWLLSLRAVGYVDVLRIPTVAVEKYILPNLKSSELPARLPVESDRENASPERRQANRQPGMQTDLLEFLMDHRYINGTQAMVIDMNRCTRCDDCVRACATAHDNNPRFQRSGPIQDGIMIAGACMHCVDPVCMIGCPTGAIGRDQATGTVVINDQTCIGCSTCSNSCPYNNITMVEISDREGKPIVDSTTGAPIEKATKCDLCVDQLGGPACQSACPHDALFRIDLSNPDPLTRLLGN